ncbi:MAG TPA: DNRLRE domain-containing protein [Balneolaceae bacterium]|nr:DNRLRE domain-containing protein [Balneolaceae bacterium]
MRKIIIITISAIVALLALQSVHAQDVAELGALKDNTLYENNTTDAALSNGAGQHFFAGMNGTSEIRRGILQFDLSGIPQGSQIESVQLHLYLNRSASSATIDIELYEVLKSWGEGTSDGTEGGRGEGRGGDATDGDATWEHTFYPDDMWDNAGGDFADAVISSAAVDDASGTYVWESTPEFVALAQKWLDSPTENHGLIIRGNEVTSGTAKRFSSRQNENESERPVLVVEYSGEVTSVDLNADTPQMLQLHQNYPNPFNPSTNIVFSVPNISDVEIAVYDMLGRKLRTLFNDRVQAGRYEVAFDASKLSSGVYLYTLQTGSQTLTRRLTVVK